METVTLRVGTSRWVLPEWQIQEEEEEKGEEEEKLNNDDYSSRLTINTKSSKKKKKENGRKFGNGLSNDERRRCIH